MSEWKEYRLGDLVKVNQNSVSKEFPFTEIEYLDTGSITCGKIDGFQKYKIDNAPSRAKRLLNKEDIIYSTVRPIQRHYGIIKNPKVNTVVSTGFAVLTCVEQKANPDFIYYFLTQDDIVNYLDSVAEGSTSAYPSLTPDVISELDISLPELAEQRAIASILSSLDDKIGLLHRQNKTLEALAETLFRQWFVEEADESWEKEILGNVISVKGGTTPSSSNPEFWDGNIYWTSPRDLSNHNSVYMFDTSRKITVEGLNEIGSGLLPVGTVLLSSRAPIGYLAITEIPVAINQGYIAIVCDKSVPNYFMYLWIKSNLDMITGAANGSVFPEISKSVFKELEISIPPNELLKNFNDTIVPKFEKIKTNQIQIRTLTQLRDTLLPKLMSGEVRVRMSESEFAGL